MSEHSNRTVNDTAARYFQILGAAAADLWSQLPQDLQSCSAIKASAMRACASNWRNFCTIITRAR